MPEAASGGRTSAFVSSPAYDRRPGWLVPVRRHCHLGADDDGRRFDRRSKGKIRPQRLERTRALGPPRQVGSPRQMGTSWQVGLGAADGVGAGSASTSTAADSAREAARLGTGPFGRRPLSGPPRGPWPYCRRSGKGSIGHLRHDTLSTRGQPAFQKLRIARHAEAEDPEHERRRPRSRSSASQATASAAPTGSTCTMPSRSNMPMISTRLVSLNSADERVDDAGDDDLQRLRQHDEPHLLRVGKPQRIGRLELPARDRLQAAADHLGEIGRREQRHHDQRPQQLVDRNIARAGTAAASPTP